MKSPSSTYISRESATQRQPVELFHIYLHGGIENWYYTSGDVDVTYDGHNYLMAPIERESIEDTSNLDVQKCIIKTVIQGPVVDYLTFNPVDLLWVKVMKLFRNQSPLEAVTLFLGQADSVSFAGKQAVIKCLRFDHYLRQEIPIYRIQPACNNFVFDTFCGKSKSSYKTTATVTRINNYRYTSATFSGLGSNYLKYGWLEWGNHKRMITYHSGSEIRVQYPIIGLATGQSVDVYAGCDLKHTTCLNKFSNLNNFFGHIYVPKDNPRTWTG